MADVLFPRATVAKYPYLGGLKQQKFILSCSRGEIPNQSGVRKAKLRGESFLAISSFCELLAVSGVH